MISPKKFHNKNVSYSDQNFPMICKIYLKLLSFIRSEDPLLVSIGTSMFKKFKKYWVQVRTILSMATIFYPGYEVSS